MELTRKNWIRREGRGKPEKWEEGSYDGLTMEKIKTNLVESTVLRSKQELISSILILPWAKKLCLLISH